MDYLEIIGTVIGVVYLYWEYKASVWLWAASIVMPAIYIFVYYNAGLYADFGISIYYLLASFYGLACWLSGKSNGESTDKSGITHTPYKFYLPITIISVLLFVLIGVVLNKFTDSSVPWVDAFTTALSISAMWMLAKKYVEQWLLWIVVDIASSALYVYKDLYFTAALYTAYTLIAFLGYRKWLKLID